MVLCLWRQWVLCVVFVEIVGVVCSICGDAGCRAYLWWRCWVLCLWAW